MKRALAFLLALVMVLSMAACGGNGNKEPAPANNNPAADPADGPSESDPPADEPSSDTPIEVVFWHSLSGTVGDELLKIVDEYNNGRGKELGIFVNAVYQGYDGTDKQILAYQTNDTANACDINVGLTSTIPSMLELDWTVKASDMYDKYEAYVPKDSFSDSLIESVSYQDEMICLPFLNSTLVFYYNVDLLKAAGFDAPPATLDELAAYTEALTEKDASGNVTRYGFECEVKRYQLVNYISVQSPDAYFGDLESGRAGAMTKITAGEDGTLKAFLEKWDALVETGGYQYVEGKIREEFANQTAAMAMFSSSKCTNVAELVGDSFQWATAPVPKVNDTDTGSAAVGGSCLVLFDRGDEARVAAAWDFMQYLSTADSQYRISTTSGYIPTNRECADLDEMKAFWEENPQYKTAFDIVMEAAPNAQEPMDLAYNEIDTVITDAMRQFCDRQLDVDGAVDAIVNGCNKLLDEWHEAND